MPYGNAESQQLQIYLNTAEAAERLGVSVETVRQMCSDGVLPGASQQYANGPWRIPTEGVEHWSAQHDRAKVGTTEALRSNLEHLRQHPVAVAASILVTLVLLLAALISAGADLPGFRELMQEWDLLPAFPRAAEGETLIVITRFYHTQGVADTDAHNEIRRAIKESVEGLGLSHVRVEVHPKKLSGEDRREAEELGKRYDASIVIWGADSGVRVSVNYLNLRWPDFEAAEVGISETERAQLVSPSDYGRLITKDLPAQLTFLSLFAIAQSYYTRGDYNGAITVLEQAVNSLVPGASPPEGAAEAYFRVGWLYQLQLLSDQNAIAAYDKALEFEPQMTAAYLNRALAHYLQSFPDMDQQSLDAALADLEKTIELAPNIPVTYDRRGMVRLSLVVAQSVDSMVTLGWDAIGGAIADFSKAIELDPEYPNAYINRGDMYDLWGRTSVALADYSKAIKLDPNDPALYYRRGRAYYRLSELDMAMDDFDAAIALRGNDPDAYLMRGCVHYEQGDLDAAIADLDKGISLKSELAEFHKGRVHVQNAWHDSSEETFRIRIQLQFGGVSLDDAYYRRGIVHAAQGHLSLAIVDFDKALEINPHFSKAYFTRGVIRYEVGKLVSAQADFDKVIEIDPDCAEAYWTRGIIQRRFSRADAALADFRAYLELRPSAENRDLIEGWIAELEAELSNK